MGWKRVNKCLAYNFSQDFPEHFESFLHASHPNTPLKPASHPNTPLKH